MPSYKTDVIERLFHRRWDEGRNVLRDPVVTLEDIQAEIRLAIDRGARASDKNAANFLYDIIRKPTANMMWPSSVFKAGYTGRQLVGTGQCFEFRQTPTGCGGAVSESFCVTSLTQRSQVQSISLPSLVRELAPSDEMAIFQIAVSLRLLETHFALRSALPMIDLTLLQMSVRFSNVTIDGLFVASLENESGRMRRALVTCEAKQQDERILEDRIIRQIQAAAQMPRGRLYCGDRGQRAPNSSIYVVEFEPVPTPRAQKVESLNVASTAVTNSGRLFEAFSNPLGSRQAAKYRTKLNVVKCKIDKRTITDGAYSLDSVELPPVLRLDRHTQRSVPVRDGELGHLLPCATVKFVGLAGRTVLNRNASVGSKRGQELIAAAVAIMEESLICPRIAFRPKIVLITPN